MSRAKLLSFIGTGTALAVAGLLYACATPSVRYGPRPIIRPSPDSVATTGPDPVPSFGYFRKRLAVGCARGCKVDVWIGAYASAYRADTTNPPASPLKIARVINTGSYDTQMYALKAHTQYDLVFQKGLDEKAEWVFEPITRTTADKKKGKVSACRGHPWPNLRSEADFRGCNAAPRVGSMKASIVGGPIEAVFGALTRVFAQGGSTLLGEDPAWFSCTAGCCTAMYSLN